MIINREIKDFINAEGKPGKQQIISFVGKEGNIQYLTYEIPNSEWFNWSYARGEDIRDKTFMSWDGKPVTKRWLPRQAGVTLCDNRAHEVLCGMIKQFPQCAGIYELNVPKTAFVDIEVEVYDTGDDSGFPKPETANNPITTISYVVDNEVIVFGRANLSDDQISGIRNKIKEHTARFTTDYNFTYKYYENEYDMLFDLFTNYFTNIPCITGWNFFGFDWPYLYNRAKNHLGIDVNCIAPTGNWTVHKVNGNNAKVNIPLHRIIYDYLEIYTKWDRSIEVKENSTLDFVASAALGVTKVQHNLGFMEMWKQEPDNYVFYNAIDSVLVREIDKKIKTSMTMYGIANLTHVDLLNNISPVRTLEIVQCEYAMEDGKVFPIAKKAGDTRDYEGAFVYPTIPGIYKDILALDFNSLYPSTMRQFNISPDTLVTKDKNRKAHPDEIKTVSGAVFKRNEKGILPKILTSFYAKRKSFKKEMMSAQEDVDFLEKVLEERLKATK